MHVLETPRLLLREATLDDAGFIFTLLNEPGWIRFIGDKGVNTLDDARRYIQDTLIAMYDRLGFGLYVTVRKETGAPIGLCGPIKRDTLDDVDIGFAFLSEYCGQGYATEAASSVLDYVGRALGLRRVVAITTRDNEASRRVLEKIGFQFECELPPDESTPPLNLLGRSLVRPETAWRISKSVAIQSDRHRVWEVLTVPALIKLWLSDADLEISADWVLGGAITSRGDWHGFAIENKGNVVAFEPGRILVYTHWSSLSQVPDIDANYALIRMRLSEADGNTILSLEQENLLTAEIYGHWNFYWNMALERIKRLAESGHL